MDNPKFGDTALYLAISWGAAFGFCVGTALNGSSVLILAIPVSVIWLAALTTAAMRGARFPERFSIRDLLWLTVVVALALGLALERWNRHSERVGYENVNNSLHRQAMKYASESAVLRQMLEDQTAPNQSAK